MNTVNILAAGLALAALASPALGADANGALANSALMLTRNAAIAVKSEKLCVARKPITLWSCAVRSCRGRLSRL